MKLAEYRARKIPEINSTQTALDYHQLPINSDHPLANEPLVDVSTYNLANESYYCRSDGLNAPYYIQIPSSLRHVWLRKSVAEKLAAINENISNFGLELFLLDGYRPIECQRTLWNNCLETAKRTLENPTEESCVKFAGRYWSNPSKFKKDDFRTWPTHATGGAIDLTLRRVGGKGDLHMGGIFDDASEISHTRFYEKDKPENDTAREARDNRRLLYWLMNDAGFASYYYEWWHYDLGNQMWVMNRELSLGEKNEAYYGLAPESAEVC